MDKYWHKTNGERYSPMVVKGAMVPDIPSSFTTMKYDGVDIELPRKHDFGIRVYGSGVLVGSRNGLAAQGMAIYNGVMAQLYNTGYCALYDISGAVPTLIKAFPLGSYQVANNHSNSAQFDSRVIEGEFPYLYVAACNVHKCFVEKITREGSTLLQTITLNLSDYPMGGSNIQVGDDGYLWLVSNYSTSYRFIKLRKPTISEGDVTLTNADIVDAWLVDGYNSADTWQGCKIYNGKLYWLYGGTYGNRGIWVFDTATHAMTHNISLNAFTRAELEDLDIYNERMYITCYGVNYGFELIF